MPQPKSDPCSAYELFRLVRSWSRSKESKRDYFFLLPDIIPKNVWSIALVEKFNTSRATHLSALLSLFFREEENIFQNEGFCVGRRNNKVYICHKAYFKRNVRRYKNFKTGHSRTPESWRYTCPEIASTSANSIQIPLWCAALPPKGRFVNCKYDDFRSDTSRLPIYILARVASDPFPVVAVDTHTVTIRRVEKFSKRISCYRTAKTLNSREHKHSSIPSVLDDNSRIWDLPTHH